MRFLSLEHKDIMGLLIKLNLTNKAKFVKRKGWVYIEIDQQSFAYHRKKESLLIDGQFEDRIEFFMVCNGKRKSLNTWEEVLINFKDWLKLSVT
ncbi:MAG: 23S rRNA A2030 N6-methylase RlmJ [Cyclobacteriaceae bacterium]|jgi:23S rRNA A2030 N6-methylase RlmJ